MVLNEAMQILRETEELKLKISKFKTGASMLHDRSMWTTQQQLQKLYQKLLILDLDYALDKKVEQDLWNVGFKQQIEALQIISKDRKNANRSDAQQMLSWVLQAAAGFYLCLLHQICTAFRLDLPFRRRASLLGLVESWGAGGGDTRTPPPAAALYICQHCLVHLGDLARYRQQLRVAHSFYRHALLVSAHSGQPYNQLALVSWRRGRRLGALYWHVRSLLVRAPFPPAPANLSRTLAAAATAVNTKTDELPVLPGVIEKTPIALSKIPTRLTAHSFVGELIRAYHLIHTLDDLETATQLVNTLNSSLTALVATDSFEPMTLVKMSCITIWLVGSATEELQVSAASMTTAEATAAALAVSLAAGAIVSLLLCSHTHTALSLQALKVYLEWVVTNPQLLRDASFLSRPQLWPALAHTLNILARHTQHFEGHNYDTVPLPEDQELHGFLPLDKALSGLKFSKYASWETYGDRVPQYEFIANDSPLPSSPTPILTSSNSPSHRKTDPVCTDNVQLLESKPALAESVRAWRLVCLGRRLVDVLHQQGADYLQLNDDEEAITFSAPQSSPDLLRILEELSLAREISASTVAADQHDSEDESDDDLRTPPPPPVIISEADFREKVREKRVGILKPQGSLERAREERALIAASQDNQSESDSAIANEKVEETPRGAAARTRTNVAMQAILRVQEESSKQVKFVTPATTPDSTLDSNEVSLIKETEKTKILQPKAIKSLANIPVGKKTGGILSLKDKSAGYPHLQNAEPEPTKKLEENDKTKKLDGPSIKLSQGPSSQSSQQSPYHPTPYSSKVRMEHHHQHPPPASWLTTGSQQSNTLIHATPYNEPPRISYSHQKKYGIQNAPVNFQNTLYSQQNPANLISQGIRLPVVNPKEIDVRSAALQKQYSRQDVFTDSPKGANQNWQVSGDKKAFLNDLPPRFANQIRQWSGVPNDQQVQYGVPSSQEKLYDDAFKPNNFMYSSNNIQSGNLLGWSKPPLSSENVTQPAYNWWSSDNNSMFNPNYPPPSITSSSAFYPPSIAGGISNPYQTSDYSQMANHQLSLSSKTNDGVPKSISSNYMPNPLNQPQAQSIQNLINTPNYNAAAGSFGNYNQNVNYDSSMYPQFTSNKLGFQPPATKMGEKPLSSYTMQKDSNASQGHGLGLGSSVNDLHPHSHLTMDLMAGVLNNDNMNLMKNLDTFGMGERNAESSNTYSLFSAGDEVLGTGWRGGVPHLPSQHHHQQSLWSGPGPSPLERLLEQQKQLNKSSSDLH